MKKQQERSPVVKLAYSVEEAAEVISISTRKFYDLLGRGDLRSVRVDGRRLVRHEDLVGYVAELEEWSA